MVRMSNLDYIIQNIKEWFTDHLAYIYMAIIVIFVAVLVHRQAIVEEQKHKNEVYELKAEIDSLKQTVDWYERGRVK